MNSPPVNQQTVTVTADCINNRVSTMLITDKGVTLVRGMMLTKIVSVAGTIQIMVGLFNIGLGPGRTSLHPGDFASMGAAYWLGAMFIVAGVFSFLADTFPAVSMVVIAVFVNILGSVFAIICILLLRKDTVELSQFDFCDDVRRYDAADDCRFVASCFVRLSKSMNYALLVLAVLQLCVCFTITVLGIRALPHPWKKEGSRDDEIYKPVLKEVLMTSPGA